MFIEEARISGEVRLRLLHDLTGGDFERRGLSRTRQTEQWDGDCG
jgi:hypothetical protein